MTQENEEHLFDLGLEKVEIETDQKRNDRRLRELLEEANGIIERIKKGYKIKP